ncbi:sorting nexin-14-like isoform X2 [Zootermopsis nevadensis]|nr:sorting nexin-14-like isoform X2 [Zootermopsis nevadensis]
MDENEAKTLIFLIWNDRLSRTSILVIIILCLFMSVMELKAWCGVCGSGKCNRHRAGPSSHTRQPWIGLEVPDEIDEAIEDFLNKTLKEFVYSWYNNLSPDESFVLELRQSIRYAASVLLRRGLQVDLAYVIINKLVPAGLSHLDDYLGVLRLSSRQQIPLDKAAVQYLGPRLHPAARNRDNELSYLRQLTALLLPQLLPSSQLHCRNFSVLIRELLSGWILLPITDVLADPAVVNSLLLLLLDNYTLSQYPNRPPTRVEFLARFVSSVPVSHGSALRLDLSSVLKDQSLLYPFMQFLKVEGCVNILQFCLDVEEFNRKMLTPDVNKQDLENLYKEAWDLFSVYFSLESPDRIHFSQQVVTEMHAVLQEPAENIVKLRTTPPLFQAYEYAYSLLENSLCPLFHESDDYYTLLCGQRLPSGYNKSGSRSMKKWSDGGAVARLSSRLHKIKGALRTQPVEGHVYDTDSALDLGETEYAEDLHLSDSSESYRDLSAWRVSIPCVDTRQDVNNKPYPVFNIDVQRIDVKSEEDPESYHWTVDRRYHDFYTLESKLTEFHGVFPDTQLPPKRILFGPRGIEFMESKRQVFEEFVQRLLQKPTLRGSDLLHSFLRSPGEFVPAGPGGIAGAMPEGLGRIIRRSVPLRLRKERGQHLDTFLNAFVASTEGSKTKTSKYEWKDMNVESPRRVRCLTKSVFQNNFGVASNQPLFALSTSRSPSSSSLPVQGVFDCLLYLAVRVFGAPQTVVRVAMAIRAVAHNTVNALFGFYLDRKLRKLLIAPRLAHLVRLLQGAVFQPKGSAPSPAELELRGSRALAQLQTLVPNYVARWAGPAYQAGLLTLFSALQSPALNKQLVYTLLDVVAAELYPDLATGEISPQ